MTRVGRFFSAVRTPAGLAAAWWGLAAHPALAATVVIWHSRHDAFHRFFCAPPSHHDCFFSLPTSLLTVPNAVNGLGYGIGLIVLIEMKLRWLPQNRTRQQDAVTALIALVLAASWLMVLDVEGPTIRLLPLALLGTLAFWGFLIVNLRTRWLERVVKRRWITRGLEWTFPVSDLVCFEWHRQRLGSQAGVLRRIPALCYLAALLVLMGSQVRLLTSSVASEKIPIVTYDPHGGWQDGKDLWFADTLVTTAGLWRYDSAVREAKPYMRAQDLRSFCLADGFVYFHDAFDDRVMKVATASSAVAWSVPVPDDAGTVELALHRTTLYVMGRAGYVAAVDLNGRRMAERRLPYRVASLQALPDGRIAFLSSDRPAVRLLDARLEHEEVIDLPAIASTVFDPLGQEPGSIALLSGTAVDAGNHVLFVAALWGEIDRYDLRAHRWLVPFRVAPGVRSIAADLPSGRLLVYNHARGYMEFRDLTTGALTARVLTPVFGNTVTPVPGGDAAVLSAHGPGATSVPRPGGLYLCRGMSSSRPAQVAKR